METNGIEAIIPSINGEIRSGQKDKLQHDSIEIDKNDEKNEPDDDYDLKFDDLYTEKESKIGALIKKTRGLIYDFFKKVSLANLYIVHV